MYKFGKISISPAEIFYESEYSIGIVNLKPIAPGHVLILPKRVVLRYALLSMEEVTDLTESARRVTKVLKEVYKDGFIWLIQDGKEAGQTVPHVHLHIIPKRFSEWYEQGIEATERIPRTVDDMRSEAEHLKTLLKTIT